MSESRGIYVRRGTRLQWVEEEQGKHFCGCGCEQPIPLKPEHFNVGIPRFLHGHNARVAPPTPRKDRPAPQPCGCGCGQLATPGRRYISGHNAKGRRMSDATRQKLADANSGERSHRYGKRPHNWKGGRTITPYGYVEVQAPDHPLAGRNGYIREHRLVAERWLQEHDPESEFLRNGYLHRGADVHHINEVKHDNRVENLEVMWRGDHTRYHLLKRYR